MPTPRRRTAAAVAVLSALLLLPLHASASGTGGDPVLPEPRAGDPVVPDVPGLPGIPDAEQDFVGWDGQVHSKAGWTVAGRNGVRYLGEELDSACYTGDRLAADLKRMAKFAQIIAASGRRVIFTVAPSKSAVYKSGLPATMPHGDCDSTGIALQDKVLDTFKDPSYIPMRAELQHLMDGGAPAYWDLDSHWTTVGSTRWAQAVAHRLDPSIARIQRYKKTERTHNPDVAFVVGNTTLTETEKARKTVTKVRSRPTAGSPPYDVDVLTGFDLSWRTSPARKTWPGHTLLMGDSFTYVGMESLIPLFRHGRYMWTGHVDTDDLIDAITKSDTVVIEVAQRYVANSPLGQLPTQLQLALALATAGRPD